MAWQLIYTSAPRGLVAGRSGFCTVARHREIRDGLVSAIERFSQYDRSGRTPGASHPVVHAHRIVRLGGSSYHVLSCTMDAGADYTGRTNHLAHHLICEPHEFAKAPSPADVLRQMEWRRTWTDAPRYFDEAIDLSRFTRKISLPAREWQALTGDAGCAALPVETRALAGCSWLYPAEAGGQTLLPLIGESLLLLDPTGRSADKLWQVPFTTYLQSTDQAADFSWRGCQQGSPAAATMQGGRQTLDFTAPRALQAPASPAAELARQGLGLSAHVPASAILKASALPNGERSKAPAAPGGEDLDLAALLASADEAPPIPTRPHPKKESLDETAKLVRIDLSEDFEPRKSSKSMPLLAGMAILLLCMIAGGFSLWRSHQAEEDRMRKVTAQTIAAAKFEAELHDLSDRANDPSFTDEIKFGALFNAATSTAASLDGPSQTSMSKRLSEAGRLFIQRRLAALAAGSAKTGPPDEAILNELRYDAKMYGLGNEFETRIAALKNQIIAPPAPEPPPVEPLVAVTPTVVVTQAPAPPDVLPSVTTYVAFGAAAKFDVSNVKEIAANWKPAPSPDQRWKLFRTPVPALNPPASSGEDCSVIGPALYDRDSQPFANLQGTEIVLKTAELVPKGKPSRAPLTGNFLLRFTPPTGEPGFQIYFVQNPPQQFALLHLAIHSLGWSREPASLTVDATVFKGLSQIQLAARAKGEMAFHATELFPDFSIPLSAKMDLKPLLKRIEDEANQKTADHKSRVAGVTAAAKARAHLLADEKSGLAYAGQELFDRREEVLTSKAQLDTFVSYAQLKTGVAGDAAASGDVFALYTIELLKIFLAKLDADITAIKDAGRHLDISKPADVPQKNALDKQLSELAPVKQALDGLIKSCVEQARARNIDGAEKVWLTVPATLGRYSAAREFSGRWMKIYSAANLKAVHSFLLWKDGNLDDAEAEILKQDPDPAKSQLQTVAENARLHFLSLAPFWIDWKGPLGNRVRVAVFEGRPNDAETGAAPK